ncbi:MAG TPA: septal ring lytic transglycosylase RlpA family lipoprotein [Chitinophagaceae bacterium]|nr:septal ring lytic transglycosylase RlpA family lipoprotein [Chitinophagaceae bacterium]HAN38676.1 septal ring lytic transglycosylase RlpA family lipoprotein [Chitinophagaceae bacterium]
MVRKLYIPLLVCCSMILLFTSCSKRGIPSESEYYRGKKVQKATGKASYYADKYEGRKTASGEVYRGSKFTAAHRTLPFGTIVTVRNLKNNKTVVVKINDRGPFVAGRIIDLSKAAARKIDMIKDGVVSVEILYVPIR